MSIAARLSQAWNTERRERVLALSRYLWKRFLEDRCFETAGALSYTTVFALVPLTAVALAVLSAFPVFGTWTSALIEFVFTNFVPEAARAVEAYILDFAGGVGGLTIAGVSALLLAALLTLGGIESTFNRIWRVPRARPPVTRVLVYWTLLTLGTLLIAAVFGFTSYLAATQLVPGAEALGAGRGLLRLLPPAMTLAAFALAFIVVPNRRVAWRHALAGALLATVLFELVKLGLTLYLRNVPTYQQLYGTLAVIPIFLLWVYLSWVSILLGASLAASLSGFRYRPRGLRLGQDQELYGMLRLLARFRDAYRSGALLHFSDLQAVEPLVSDDALSAMLGRLVDHGAVRREETGGWMLARDLDHLVFARLYDDVGLRLPVGRLSPPLADDPTGASALRALERLRAPLKDTLDLTVGELLAGPEKTR